MPDMDLVICPDGEGANLRRIGEKFEMVISSSTINPTVIDIGSFSHYLWRIPEYGSSTTSFRIMKILASR